jgi:putative peptide zinc metalloprotease protein
VAAVLQEERFAPGRVIVQEGAVGDRLFLIAGGKAEVTTTNPGGPMVLATLEAGEIFGEIALLLPRHQRQATVTAFTPLLTLTLSSAEFTRMLDLYPQAKSAWEAAAETLLIAKFLKQASPFARLDAKRLGWLAARLKPLTVPAGADIVHQGEPGEACYLLRAGAVEVVLRDNEDQDRRLATLGPGALFGEAALLTAAPRNATVQAREHCDLLALHRTDLLAVMGADRHVAARLTELLSFRDRPRSVPGIMAQTRHTPDGETVTILKDPSRGAYFRLSPSGWFLWERLDGRHSLRDLVLEYFQEFKSFSPQVIAEVIGGLAAAGFIETGALRQDVSEIAFRPSWGQQAAGWARHLLEWRWEIRPVDQVITRLYQGGGYLAFTRAGRIVTGLLALAGLAAFCRGSARAIRSIVGPGGDSQLLWFLIPALLLAIVVHEAGHAFTTKAFGYEVHSLGLGWYWFGPIAFVDTSDLWLAGRWPRICVSLAGAYANLVLAGLAGLAGMCTAHLAFAAALWQFALLSYVMVLVNLNPLLEYDGYYVLMDLLERPNLRRHCLRWLGTQFFQAVRTSKGLKGHGVELLYGQGSICYVALIVALTLLFYRLFLQEWLTRFLPGAIATYLAWGLALAVAVLSKAGVIGELRDIGTESG